MIRQNYIKYIDGIEEAEKLKAVLRVDDEELSIQRQSSMVRIRVFYFIILVTVLSVRLLRKIFRFYQHKLSINCFNSICQTAKGFD